MGGEVENNGWKKGGKKEMGKETVFLETNGNPC